MVKSMEKQRKKSVKVNFIMNAILNMSSFIFPLITFPYVSRVLSPTGYGKVSFATSVISYFVIIAQLGVPTYGIRACAKVRDDEDQLNQTVQEIFVISVIMCALTYVLFFLSMLFVPRFREDKILFLIVSSSILFYTIGVEWLYKALEKYSYITIRSILFKFVALLAMFLMVRSEADYVIYGGISIFGAAASNVMNFMYLPHVMKLKPAHRYELKKHLKPIAIFFGMSCATTIYVHLDSVMLGFMKTDADVGYYNVAIKTKMILVSVITSLGTVLLPRVSYYIQNKMVEEFKVITKKALNFVIILSIPLTLYFILYAPESVYFLAGKEYEASIIPMMIIVLTLPFIGMTNIMGIQILVPMGREKDVLYSEIAGAVVDLILNCLLIPKFASAGAAMGTLMAEIAVWIVQYRALKEEVIPAYKSIHYRSIFLALIGGGIASIWIKMLQWTPFFALVASSVLFFAIYGGLLLLQKEQLAWDILMQLKTMMLKKVKKEG